ncbi:MAG: aminotransferase class I/II-fold pyridoxal phosphate-dependent enzyme, partial [Gammaproteobacteria bacterium]|nr:aminotransferase class I/II-fold pyridoxal phosphate-dependent enzyme [Gammaproteobacteria bacterium]
MPTATGSRRMQAVQDPIVPEIAGLLASHPDAVSLGQGVVHYPPPPSVLGAAQQYANTSAENLYGPVDGEPALLAALATKLRDENGIETGTGERGIMVTAGANMAFLHA